MIDALSKSGTTLLAFDDFQCLDPALLPIAIETWLRQRCHPIRLAGCRRTDNADLIAAAIAVREGRAVNCKGRKFKVMATPGRPHFAATCIANGISWSGGGVVAILTPSRTGGFAEAAVALVCEGPVGRQKAGPYPIRWEASYYQAAEEIWNGLGVPPLCDSVEALAALTPHRSIPVVRLLRDWIVQAKARGFSH